MRQNTKTNYLIRNIVILCDFLLLSLLLAVFVGTSRGASLSMGVPYRLLLLMSAISLAISEYFFPTVIHKRLLQSEHILRQVTLLVLTQCILTYLLTKSVFLLTHLHSPHSLFTLTFTLGYYPAMLALRFMERWIVKRYRRRGGNTRTVILVGSDEALQPVYKFLMSDPATGYRVLGYYANRTLPQTPSESDEHMKEKSLNPPIAHLGTLADLEQCLSQKYDATAEAATDGSASFVIPDEFYCSLSWTKREDIHRIMRFCDRHAIHFYFVPVYAESFGQSLKIEQIGETVGYTPYTDPLQLPMNMFVKRTFDMLLSGIFLLCLIPLLPIVALIIKIQSPGPVFFRQLRTGMGGQNFMCYKFRSMHVNDDADRLQATKDDPRKFPFGNFMRKANIDELPQFWNVFKGDMSIVGPRPHMLAHTEQYSSLIDKYMVRHFVKPGVTGWAQVTGFRGETRELWQMEGRVKRDIWYIENWSLWLDIRIIWLTAKQLIVHDEHAY